MQRGGDRIRVNVQLIDTETGGHLWAERFDRDRADLFKVQDEISRSVANSLRVQVDAAELERGKREQSSNLDADDLILRANAAELLGSTPDKYAVRLKLFEQAAQLDSRNVIACAGVAVCRATRTFLGWSSDRADDLRSGTAAVEQSLSIGPNHHFAIFAKGHVAFARRDYAAALEAYEYAIGLNPSRPVYLHLAGSTKISLGRAEDALESLNEVIRLSPRDLFIADFFSCVGWANWELERYPEAIQWLERSKAQNARFTWSNAYLASTYLRIGQQEKAEAAIRDGLRYQPNWTSKVVEESYPLRPESLAALVEDLRKAGLAHQ